MPLDRLKIPLNNLQEIPDIDQCYCKCTKVTSSIFDHFGSCHFSLPVNFKSVKTAGGMEHCLCDTVLPILILSRYVGIIPLTTHHPKNDSGRKTGSCQLNFQWKSVSNLINIILISGFVGFLPFAFVKIKLHMQSVFNGTDLYAFTLQMFAMIFETTVILVAGRFFRSKFTEGWTELNQVYHAMCEAADDLLPIKVGAYIASGLSILEFAAFYFFILRISHNSMGFYQNCFYTFFWTFVVNLTLFIPFVLTILFLFICLLIRSHFTKISEMLTSVMKKPGSPSFHQKIDSLRVLHEQCCHAVQLFEDFFGIQILLTLCTCCFTVIIGAYASIVQSEGISSSELSGAWSAHMYSAAIFIILILVSGQLVTNSASSPGPVLNSLSFTELDAKSQIQVSAFLHKISQFPTKMTAVKTINISTTFLASAATNITTYLLVLMQFKLSLENKMTKTGNVTVNGNAM